MFEHHRQTIGNLKEHFTKSDRYLAFIVNGSVARGEAREDSDVDFLLVVNEHHYKELSAANALLIEANEYCAPPCSEANGVVTAKSALREIKDQGNEIAKWAFHEARIIFSKDGDIDRLIQEIPRYPEEGRTRRMESYYSQIFHHFSFFEFAYYSQNKYLLYETATKMILAAGRLILADNRILYPNRKRFFSELKKAPQKPAEICEALLSFLDEPTLETGQQIIEKMQAYKEYPLPPEGLKARINKESLLNLEEW